MQTNLHHSSSSSDSLSGTAWMAPYHLITSLICVVLLPTAVLLVYQNSSRSRYAALQKASEDACTTTAAAASSNETLTRKATKQQQWDKQEQQTGQHGSSSSRLTPAGAVAEPDVQPCVARNHFLADISSSLQAAAAPSGKPEPSAFSFAVEGIQQHTGTTSSSSSSRYPTVLSPQAADNLRLLLADDAAAVFEAAAAATAAAERSREVDTYESMAYSLPVSIKVGHPSNHNSTMCTCRAKLKQSCTSLCLMAQCRSQYIILYLQPISLCSQ